MKLGRNDPCPCNSGKKYKKCCLRVEFVALEYSQAERKVVGKIFEAARSNKPNHGCLAPVENGEICGKKAIKSHTVGLGRELRRIADQNGKVLGARLNLSAIFDPFGGAFEDVHIKQASVFPGFCKHHDQTVFEPIDDQQWNGSSEHIFLLAYRALCREVYAKLSNVESFMPAAISNATGEGEEMLRRWNHGEELGLQESLRDKKAMDSILLSQNYECQSHIVSLGKDFPVRVAGVFVPEFDFDDKKLFDLSDYSTPVYRISVCTHSTDDDVLGVISAFDDHPKLHMYMESLKRQMENSPRAYFAQICFDNFEHIYLGKRWWSQLRKRQQNDIETRFESSAPGRRPHGMHLDPLFKLV